MIHKKTETIAVAAAKAGFIRAAGYRLAADPPPAREKKPRGRRRPDPLADIFDSVVVPILEENPEIRPVGVFEAVMSRHPELDPGVRRSLERRIRTWRAEHGAEKDVIFRQKHEPGRQGLSDFSPSRARSRYTVDGASGWSTPWRRAASMMMRTNQPGFPAFSAIGRSAISAGSRLDLPRSVRGLGYRASKPPRR